MSKIFFKGLFQPFYTSLLFVIYLVQCGYLLDNKFFKMDVLFLVGLGVLSAQTLDNLGGSSPEDWVNQPDRVFILNRFRKFLSPFIIAILIFVTILIFNLMPNKSLYLKLISAVGIIFIAYTNGFDGWRLKKVRYLKSFFVSTSWILLAIAIDFGTHRDHFFLKTKGLLFVVCSLILLVSDTLLLDLRDKVGDRLFDIWSFPKKYDSHLHKIIFWANLTCALVVGLAHQVLPGVWPTLLAANLTLAFSARAAPYILNRNFYLILVSLWIPVSVSVLFFWLR